ncbi:putative scytalone dehydratase [Phaeomoniella chlamydospora]|uniref:Putative scytalone dehydratase n=1 Tax=Phaeomoniella chlamydospora TaxID=158046 RepID=A0A0G2EVX1_PHACM|nr:putative scytalone dehydratase [Phaeomoniella chlamydospora]
MADAVKIAASKLAEALALLNTATAKQTSNGELTPVSPAEEAILSEKSPIAVETVEIKTTEQDDAPAPNASASTISFEGMSFLNKLWPAMPASEFVAMASSPTVLGSPLLKTQHFIGGSRWEKINETEVVGYHQLRVPHQKYVDESMKEVKVKGHAHSTNTHWYRKVDGIWKFAGLAPEIRWAEYDFDRVFEEGRDELGEETTQNDTPATTTTIEDKSSDKGSDDSKTEVGETSEDEKEAVGKDLIGKVMGVPSMEVAEVLVPETGLDTGLQQLQDSGVAIAV